MPPSKSTRDARQRLKRENEQTKQDVSTNDVLKANLKILDMLGVVIQNNPDVSFSEIVTRHLTKGFSLDKWEETEIYQ